MIDRNIIADQHHLCGTVPVFFAIKYHEENKGILGYTTPLSSADGLPSRHFTLREISSGSAWVYLQLVPYVH